MSGKKRSNNTPKKPGKTPKGSTPKESVDASSEELPDQKSEQTLADQSADHDLDKSLDGSINELLELDVNDATLSSGDQIEPEPSSLESGDETAAADSAKDNTSESASGKVPALSDDVITEPVLNDSDSSSQVSEPELTTELESESAPEQASESVSNAHDPAASTVATDKPAKSSGIVKKIGLILLLLLIGIVVIAGYFGWQYWQQLQNDRQGQSQAVSAVADLEAKFSSQLAAQQKTLEALSAQTMSANSSVDDMRLQVEKTSGQQDWVKQRLENHTNRLRSLAGTSREDWILAEARYLLRLANQRLLTERGTTSSQALLKTVDKMLLDLDDADLFSVRKAIQNDIAALRLAPSVDREGVYLRIGAIAKQLRSIPSAPMSGVAPSANSNTAPEKTAEVGAAEVQSGESTESEPSSWYSPITGSLSKAWGAVANSVEVRHYDATPKLFISEQEEASIRHNLHLLLTQAQLSLLREEPEIYKNSLNSAIEWMDQYFNYYDKKSLLTEELASLQAIPVAQALPDISTSLKVLTDYIERYHKLTPDKATETASDQDDAQEQKAAAEPSQSSEQKSSEQEASK